MTYTLKLNDGRVAAQLIAGSDRAAELGAEHVLQVSNVHVPLEEAILERSGHVTGPENGSAGIVYDTPYAVRQHEDLTFQHDQGRTAKYLENALNSEAAAVREIARRELHL